MRRMTILALLLLLPLALEAQEGAGGYYEPRTEELRWDYVTSAAGLALGAIRQAGDDRIARRVAEAEARLWQRVAEDQAEDILVMRGECLHLEALLRWSGGATFVMGLLTLGFIVAYIFRGMKIRIKKE